MNELRFKLLRNTFDFECSNNMLINFKQVASYATKIHILQVYEAEWQNFTVARNVLTKPKYLMIFNRNIYRLKDLSPSPYVTQLIGICNDTFITEFYPHGRADDFENFLEILQPSFRSAHWRLSMCISYAQILQFLHNSPMGVFMMCDANFVGKSLRQLLLGEDMRLVLNDVDDVREVDPDNGIVCNKRSHIRGDFMAPEMIWPHKNISK